MASGFSFGAKTTTALTFGSTSLSFATPTSQSQPANLTFGASTAPASTATMFTSTATGLAPPAAAQAGTPSLFGTGLFATPTTTTVPTLSFGAQPATTTSTIPTLSFGVQPATTSAGLFAVPTTTTAPPSFGATLGQPALASTGSTALSFGIPAASTAAPSLGFGLTSSASTGGIKLGLTPATNAPTLNFGLGATSVAASAAPATSTVSVGLGGIAVHGKTLTTQKEVAPKEQPLPNEILQTVEAFKQMVKQQKAHSSDISRCSIRDFRRVEQEIDQLGNQLNEVEMQLQRNRLMAEKLKYDTANTVQDVEMAQRTRDTPPGLQYENTAPLKFFLNLADQFENHMQSLKQQIEMMEKYVKTHKDPYSLTPQDLSTGMRRLHDTFVALAGRLQAVHSQVEAQKELYLNIRKHLLQDSSNPFEKLEKGPSGRIGHYNAFAHSPPKVATGPTPFSNMAVMNMSGAAAPQPPPGQPPAYPGSFSSQPGSGFGSVGFGASGGAQTSNTSLFGSTSFNQSFNSPFQLQKPPTGTKRGKV